MRSLLFLLAITLAPQALAQDAPNIAGFRLGMTPEEVRSVDPDLAWSSDLTRPRFKATNHGGELAGTRFSTFDLIFENGRLEFVGGGGQVGEQTVERCIDRILNIVAEFERSAGPLTAGEADVHPSDLEPIRTPGGSFVRRYAGVRGGLGVIATAHAPASIEVRGGAYEGERGVDCPFAFGMSAASAPPPDLPRSSISGIDWLAVPDISRYYPDAAMEFARPGKAILICTVAADGSLAPCTVGYENPAGWGFGEAALRAVRHVRMGPQTADGTATVGATVRQVIRFQQPY
jgi:TonB family protein